MIKRQLGPAGRIFVIPFWIPTLFFAVILRLSHPLEYSRRRNRKKIGLCIKCGYDLRGSEGRCAECRTAFESSAVEVLGSSTGDGGG